MSRLLLLIQKPVYSLKYKHLHYPDLKYYQIPWLLLDALPDKPAIFLHAYDANKNDTSQRHPLVFAYSINRTYQDLFCSILQKHLTVYQGCFVTNTIMVVFFPELRSHFFDYFQNQNRHALKIREDLSTNQPMNSHLRLFRAFLDDVRTTTTPAQTEVCVIWWDFLDVKSQTLISKEA